MNNKYGCGQTHKKERQRNDSGAKYEEGKNTICYSIPSSIAGQMKKITRI